MQALVWNVKIKCSDDGEEEGEEEEEEVEEVMEVEDLEM